MQYMLGGICLKPIFYRSTFTTILPKLSPHFAKSSAHLAKMREYASTQTLVIHQWAGPSVVAQLAPDSTPDRAE